jgi:hypothetical protein
MLRGIIRFFFADSWINSRVICLISICLGVYALYVDAYVERMPAQVVPYPVHFTTVIGGNLVALYLIEIHENAIQLYIGLIVLWIFFIVSFGGAFFGW